MCVSLGRTWPAHSDPGLVSQGTRGVAMNPQFMEVPWVFKSRWVRDEEFDEVTHIWRWEGYSVFWTISEDVMSGFDI